MREEILDFLKMHDVKYKEDINLASISPIRIGDAASIVAYPDEESKLCKLATLLSKAKIKHKIVGRMSNLLPPDKKYEGVVVRSDLLKSCYLSENALTVSAGMSLAACANFLCKSSLSGFEGLSGIPGSIGGALIGNAGAFGMEISDTLLDIRVFDLKTESIRILQKEDCGFTYRHSELRNGELIILSARFLLKKSDRASVSAEMERCKAIRLLTQPREPSLGSTFKRPGQDVFAARLIDQCGLKGYRIGGAEISKKHAGFIINSGSATASDYIELSEYARNCVYENYKISLEREIEIIR